MRCETGASPPATALLARERRAASRSILISVSALPLQDLKKLEELGKDIQIGKYIASGVVVFDMTSLSVKWMARV